MKKLFYSVTTLASITTTYAQTGNVGVNTSSPQTTLDVRAINHLGAVSATDGITAPRVNDLATAGTIDGQLVYLTTNAGAFSKGFHFWNGTAWTPFDTTNDAFINNATSTRVELGTTAAGAARNANAAFVIKDDAKTGIGTNDPLNLLHITDGSTSGLSQMYGKGIALTAGGGNTPRIYLENLNAPTGQRSFQMSAADGVLKFNALTDDAGATLPSAGYPGIVSITPAATVGIGTDTPTSRFQITQSSGNTLNLANFHIDNCGITCAQGTARNVVLSNANGSNSTFASLDFVANIIPTSPSGASIQGIDRDATNNYAGMQFWTRNATDYAPRITLKSSGNVGIGIAAPLNKLDVAAGNINIENTNAGGSTGVIKMNNANFMHNYNGVYLGASAGNTSNTGSLNVGIGNNTLTAITTATDAVAVGAGALGKTTTGSFNTTVGSAAMFNNTTGDNNVSMGTSSMYFNTTGRHNTAIGTFALNKNTTGIQNTAIGKQALEDNTTGNNNTMLGFLAGNGITTGSNNTIIGASFAALPAAMSNNIIIGDGAGNRRINVLANGNIGFNNTNPLSPIQHSTGATLSAAGTWTNASDRRLKHDIKDSKYGLATVMKLRPVDYIMNSDNRPQVGLIAQELKTIVPEVVSGKEGDISKGETLGVSYGNLVPVLINAIKEQQKQIDALKKEIELLKK